MIKRVKEWFFNHFGIFVVNHVATLRWLRHLSEEMNIEGVYCPDKHMAFPANWWVEGDQLFIYCESYEIPLVNNIITQLDAKIAQKYRLKRAYESGCESGAGWIVDGEFLATTDIPSNEAIATKFRQLPLLTHEKQIRGLTAANGVYVKCDGKFIIPNVTAVANRYWYKRVSK